MTRIVQLTTYPLKSPRHGGQLRCAAIRKRYRGIGFEVDTIAVMHEDFYRVGEREKYDIALPASLPEWDPRQPRLVDRQTGLCLANDPVWFDVFTSRLRELRPDAIQLEHPWLFPAVERWLEREGLDEVTRPRIVYSAHNIESTLKRDELRDDGPIDTDVHAQIDEIHALEHRLAARADLVFACTSEDLSELRAPASSRESRGTWIVAPNAIEPFEPDAGRTSRMRKRLGLDRYALFVGSAHPPNASGFWEMFAPSLAFLRPDERIVVAGSVGHILRDHKIYRTWSGINEPRLAVLGGVEHDELTALLGGATVIVLPITTGSGSNLKTAEAIHSGRRVLATPHALRGYGDPARLSMVRVADTPDAFRCALREMLDADVPLVPGGEAVRLEVTWDHALAPLIRAVRALLGRRDLRGAAP